MSNDYIYYVESNLVCFLIFGIMWVHDRFNIDRQEKQIKYDHALIAFMLYFISDGLWAAVVGGLLPKTVFTAIFTNFLNYVVMAGVTYTWLHYVMAVEQSPNRNKKIMRFAILIPFILFTVALIVLFAFFRSVMLDDALEPRLAMIICQAAVPITYIIAIMCYTLRKIPTETDLTEKKKHIYIGLFPFIVVVGGVIQFIIPQIPVFCFSCTILMLIFYIQSMDNQISLDPLTGLNNRGQLRRFLRQDAGGRSDGKKTFVMMVDVNNFKQINDTYGHAEGDWVLVMIAGSLKTVTQNNNISAFLGRYGGDEFVLIIQVSDEKNIETFADDLNDEIESRCKDHVPSYPVTVGVGYDEWFGGQDTFEKCMQRADHKLYLNKEYSKLQIR